MISNFSQASGWSALSLIFKSIHISADRQTKVYCQEILIWAHGHLSKLLYVSNKMASIASKPLHACFPIYFLLASNALPTAQFPNLYIDICVFYKFKHSFLKSSLFINLSDFGKVLYKCCDPFPASWSKWGVGSVFVSIFCLFQRKKYWLNSYFDHPFRNVSNLLEKL